MAEDLYGLLGVPKTADADTIKKAYRRLAKDLHPDKNPGNAQAEAKFKAVNRAFDTLGDAQKRKLYDEFGEEGLREGFDPEKARANKLTPEQQEAINQMKRFTDFNDLATKSSLGREALDRQVRSEVGLAIEKHQERIEQKRLEQVQTQADKQQPRRAMSR